MNIKRKLTYLSTLMLLLTLSVSAGAQVYYSCDFEDAQQNQSWTLNNGPRAVNCENKWFIGEPGNFSEHGHGGLFISADSTNAVYTSKSSMYIVSYDTMTLAPGNYVLEFDWRLLGNKNSAKLYVTWVPQTQATNSNNASASATWFTQGPIAVLNGARSWKPERFSFTVSQASSAGKLCFVFASSLDGGKPNPPSACVDNIVIHAPSVCAKPTNVKYVENTASLSWGGTGTEFQVRDYCVKENTVKEYENVTTKTMKVAMIGEGWHNFYVRNVCGDGVYSEWVMVQSFVWFPGNRCLDYMDLSNRNVCRCYTGEAESNDYNAFKTVGNPVIGNSGDWSTGSHTLHNDPNEYDPNTDGLLPTVPDGELMSVRLGNSARGSKAEGIVYSLPIAKGESKILKLKYALVMEYASHHEPGGSESGHHGSNEQSHFYVEIRDGSGKTQGEGCSTFNFSADPDISKLGPGWHVAGSGGSEGVIWKEWDEVSISLVEFAGQTIQIRLANYDCTAGGHYGYAYFALDCEDGGLQGVACGDFSTDHFDAPEGFNYRWYSADDPTKTVLSTARTFNISKTTDSIYLVDVINTVNDCYYTLTANPNPRFPVAEMDTLSVTSADCMNKAVFSNKSHVAIVNRKDGTRTEVEDLVDEVLWDFGDGTPVIKSKDSRMTHEFPTTGGRFECVMSASMSGGICVETDTIVLIFPDLIHTGDTLRSDHPVRHPYTGISGKVWNSEVDTMYIDSIMKPNQYGCDAPFYEYIYFHSMIRDTLHHMMCAGDSIQFEVGDTLHGYRMVTFYESTLDSAKYVTAEMGDSMRYLDLYVVPRVEISCDTALWICGDDQNLPIDIRAVAGERQVDSIYIYTDERAQKEGRAPLYQFAYGDDVVLPLDSIKEDGKHYYMRPDDYELKLHVVVTYDTVGAPLCPVEDHDISLHIRYASFIMYQKHGFIGLYNSANNQYGYDYVNKFTWYCDDVLMPNDTLAYIRVKDSDWGKQYRVEVTRLDDGKTMISCPLTYTYGMPEGVDDMSADESVVAYFDLLGRRYATLPEKTGVYVVVFTNHSKKIVVH